MSAVPRRTKLNMKSKAIGLRIPAALWEQVSNYGCENFPKPDSEGGKDFDITSTLLELINKGLGNDSVEQPDKQTVEQIVKDLVSQTVEQPVKQIDEQSVQRVVEQCVELQLNEVLNELRSSVDVEQQIETAIAKRLPSSLAKAKCEALVELKSDEEFIKAIAIEVQKLDNATTDNVQYPNVRRSTADEEEEEEAEKSPLTTSLTDSELAKRMGMNKSTIYRYRTGKPKQSPGYQQVMQDWQPVGDRWYQKGHGF